MERFEIDYALMKRCIKNKKLTYIELEEKSGISRKTIGNVLNGRHAPSFEVANQLVETLELTDEEALRIFLPASLRLRERIE